MSPLFVMIASIREVASPEIKDLRAGRHVSTGMDESEDGYGRVAMVSVPHYIDKRSESGERTYPSRHPTFRHDFDAHGHVICRKVLLEIEN